MSDDSSLQANGTVTSTGIIRNRSPGWAPVPKLVNTGVAGAVTVILFKIAHLVAPSVVLDADLQSAVTVVVSVLVGYLTPPAGVTAPATMAGASNVAGAILLALFLGSCAALGPPAPSGTAGTVAVDPDAQKLTVCRAYDATLRSLAGFAGAGKLSPAEIGSVNTARPTLNAMCKSDAPWTQSIVDQAEVILTGLITTERAHQ